MGKQNGKTPQIGIYCQALQAPAWPPYDRHSSEVTTLNIFQWHWRHWQEGIYNDMLTSCTSCLMRSSHFFPPKPGIMSPTKVTRVNEIRNVTFLPQCLAHAKHVHGGSECTDVGKEADPWVAHHFGFAHIRLCIEARIALCNLLRGTFPVPKLKSPLSLPML